MEPMWLALAISSALLAGVSLTCGSAHYPLLAGVPAERWHEAHDRHTRGIGWVVAPPMLVQTAALGILVARGLPWQWLWPSLLAWLLSVGWTAAVSGPTHARLARGHDPAMLRRLLRTHHVRSVAWTLQSLLACAYLMQSMNSPGPA